MTKSVKGTRIYRCGTTWINALQKLNDLFILVICQQFDK